DILRRTLIQTATEGGGTSRCKCRLQLVYEAEIAHDEPAGFVLEDAVHAPDRVHQPWPRIGLSMYMACMQGASKPVRHMSRTSTMRSGSVASRKRLASASCRGLLRMCACPVITTLMAPRASSSSCQWGLTFTISRCSSTQMRRLIA